MEINVTSCKDCPFLNYSDFNGGHYFCWQNSEKICVEHDDLPDDMPSWCPLKNEPVVVKMKPTTSLSRHV